MAAEFTAPMLAHQVFDPHPFGGKVMLALLIFGTVAVVAVAGYFGIKKLRYVTSAAAAKTAAKILAALDEAHKPLNLSEIMTATGGGSALVSNAIKFLYSQGLVSSTQRVGTMEVLADKGRYAINANGRRWLRQARADGRISEEGK